MRSLLLSSALILGLGWAAPVLADPAPATPAAAQPAAQDQAPAPAAKAKHKTRSYDNDDEEVCDNVRPTGTHMVSSYCNTRGNLRLQQQQAQDAVSENQGSRMQIPPSTLKPK